MKISEAILVAVFLMFIYAGGFYHGVVSSEREATNETQNQLIQFLMKQQAFIKDNFKGT